MSELWVQLLVTFVGVVATISTLMNRWIETTAEAASVQTQTDKAILLDWSSTKVLALECNDKLEQANKLIADLRVQVAILEANISQIPSMIARIAELEGKVLSLEQELAQETERADANDQRAQKAEAALKDLQMRLENLKRNNQEQDEQESGE
jgi:chromosome segregation ATPase